MVASHGTASRLWTHHRGAWLPPPAPELDCTSRRAALPSAGHSTAAATSTCCLPKKRWHRHQVQLRSRLKQLAEATRLMWCSSTATTHSESTSMQPSSSASTTPRPLLAQRFNRAVAVTISSRNIAAGLCTTVEHFHRSRRGARAHCLRLTRVARLPRESLGHTRAGPFLSGTLDDIIAWCWRGDSPAGAWRAAGLAKEDHDGSHCLSG